MSLEIRTLHLGPLDNNTYLLTDPVTRATAIVDVGFEPEAVLAAVKEHTLDVRYLLGTHAHYDHAAGMCALQEALGADYWLHPGDRPLLDVLAQQGAAFGFPAVPPPDVVRDLEDGQLLPLGGQALRVIHTPGHSPGHVSFLWREHLWSGDVLFAGSIGRTDLPGGSFETLERSIRDRLFTLGDAVRVYTGHGPGTTIGTERATNPFVGDATR